MSGGQLGLYDLRSPECPFDEYLDEGDNHCNDNGFSPIGYSLVSEDRADCDAWLAEVGWVDIQDITARDIPIPSMPVYVPTITRGSGRLFERYKPNMVAVKLRDVVSPETLQVADSLEKRFGIPPGTPVMLQSYPKDRLLENLWPRRHEVFPKLAGLGFCAATGLNYSVWRSQPHAERLVNIKRTHITYRELQDLGVPAIPHISWSGKVNLDAWVKWLDNNPTVQVVAVDMQTLRKNDDWTYALAGLEYFVGQLTRPIHFVITGPSSPLRVAQIKQILPSMTLTNGAAARKAFASQRIESNGLRTSVSYTKEHKGLLLKRNVELYAEMMRPKVPPNSRYFQRRVLQKRTIRHPKAVGQKDSVIITV